jgi:glycosyltransferase involved in cell wall biosynthesis
MTPHPTRYLVVVPVPFWPLPEGKAAIESAFAEHLVQLLASLRPCVEAIEVVAPVMDAASYDRSRNTLRVFDPSADHITCVAAYPANAGTLGHLLGLPGLAVRLWRAVGRAAFVHAGPSHLWRPFENLALLIGWLRRRTTVYITDIDHRESARMNLATGAWSRGAFWRSRLVYQPWLSLQHHLARLCCSVLFLKGQGLVRDYGRGQPHVHYLLDCAHGADLVIDAAQLEARCARMLQPGAPLRACYFGRLVPYKGIDRMLAAVAEARARGAEVSFDVFGNGEAEAPLRRLAADLGIAEHVHFHGALPYGKPLFAALDRCDLLLAAPLREDTPRSAVDAQALGMGVLAFDTYYYRELAAQGAGVQVVPWPDTAALTEALQTLAADRAALAGMARAGVAFARANTQEQWLRRRAASTPGIDPPLSAGRAS